MIRDVGLALAMGDTVVDVMAHKWAKQAQTKMVAIVVLEGVTSTSVLGT